MEINGLLNSFKTSYYHNVELKFLIIQSAPQHISLNILYVSNMLVRTPQARWSVLGHPWSDSTLTHYRTICHSLNIFSLECSKSARTLHSVCVMSYTVTSSTPLCKDAGLLNNVLSRLLERSLLETSLYRVPVSRDVEFKFGLSEDRAVSAPGSSWTMEL